MDVRRVQLDSQYMRIQRDWDKGTLHLSQEAAIEKLAVRFGLNDFVGRGPSVPMDPNL